MAGLKRWKPLEEEQYLYWAAGRKRNVLVGIYVTLNGLGVLYRSPALFPEKIEEKMGEFIKEKNCPVVFLEHISGLGCAPLAFKLFSSHKSPHPDYWLERNGGLP